MPASRAIIQTQVLRNQVIPSETLEVDLLPALRMALEAGLGCAILSRATVLSDLAAEKYHARRIIDPPLTRSLGLIALADRPQTKAFLEVRKTVIEVVRAAVSDKRWPATDHGRRRTRAAKRPEPLSLAEVVGGLSMSARQSIGPSVETKLCRGRY